MRIGLQLPSFTWPGGTAEIAPRLAEIAAAADEAGFDSVWVMDHLYQIPSWGEPGDHPMLEAYTTLGYLASVTRRARLGALVSSAFFRHPALLVKAATTLDVLSGGRAYLGVGAGWFEREARGLGITYPDQPERFRRLEETLRVIRHLWSGSAEPFWGRTVRMEEPVLVPAPLQRPRPPVMVGGGGRRTTLRLVARYADACNLITIPERVDAAFAALREHCLSVGRPYEEIERTVLDAEDVRRDHDKAYAWDPAYEVARMRDWSDHGAQHVIVNMADAHDVAKLRLFGREIVPAVHGLRSAPAAS